MTLKARLITVSVTEDEEFEVERLTDLAEGKGGLSLSMMAVRAIVDALASEHGMDSDEYLTAVLQMDCFQDPEGPEPVEED